MVAPIGAARLWNAATVRLDLAAVRDVIDRFTGLSAEQRAGTMAQATVERTIREFLLAATLDAPDVTGGGGFWRGADRDVVFDWADANDWFVEVRLNMDSVPVLGHLEIHYRSDWDPQKVERDVRRLEDAAEVARRDGRKAWTGLVSIGPGSRGRVAELSERIHRYYTATRPARIELVPAAGFPQGSWTFIDAIVLPSIWFKKYDFHEARDGSSTRWPVFVPVECASGDGLDDIRPLAVARAFIASYLRKVNGEPWDSAAWDPQNDEAVMGAARTPQSWRHHAISMRVDAPATLYYDMLGNQGPPWQTWTAGRLPWQRRPIDFPDVSAAADGIA
jgi:hypothetical protein